jgi:hypothetical protein
MFASCKKDNVDNTPYVYSSKVILNNLPPIMGGGIDSDGSLITFSLPLLGDDNYHSNIILSAKISNIDRNGNKIDLYDFTNKTFSYGSWIKDTFAGNFAWIPEGVSVNLVPNGKRGIYFSYNKSSEISLIQNKSIGNLQLIDGVASMTSNREKGIYAITMPLYKGDYPYTLSNPPTIYEIDSLDVKTKYFEFPINFVFNANCGYGGSKNAMYPIDIIIDIVADTSNNIYVCFGNDNIIYKVDKDKNLTTLIDNIHSPVSIALDNSNNLFVVSAPEFTKNNESFFDMVKPVEVLFINNLMPKTIYKGEYKNFGGCMSNVKNDGIFHISGAHYNLSINSSNEMFLEDPLAGQVVLIK